MNNLKSALVTLSLAASTAAFAWGQTGHRVVGKIAENHLSKEAKKALSCLLGDESLAEASNWMDNIKSDSTYDYAGPWHYMTVPDGMTYHTCEKVEEGDVYEAINRMKAILKNSDESREKKIEALKMLVHLVGDMHQPLHIGNGTDRGGNNVKIKWFYEKSNLHRIWDSEMIDSKQYSYSELAEILDHADESTLVKLQSDNMDVWVEEAMALRTQIYSFDDPENLSYSYQYQNWATVKNQLFKAGIRLAGVLNEVLSC